MISVIIPNYNHGKYLNQRIDSVLNQTYQDFELILMDDCSTDNSRDILELYRDHPKVSQIIYNEYNSGSTFKQWRRGVSLAKGEYIWIAESDDWADNNLLETLYNNITKESNVVLSYCQSYKINSQGDITGTWKEQAQEIYNGDVFFSQEFICSGIDFIDQFLIYQNFVPNASAVLFKREIYYKAEEVDLDVRACSDWLLWLKIITLGKVAFSPLVLNYFRYHEKSVIATLQREESLILFSYFDNVARKKYNTFLDKKNITLSQDKNKELIEKGYIIDIFDCYNRKIYLKMIYIFFITLIESKNKKKLIQRLIKYIAK